MKSLKVNASVNLVRVIINILFPLLTFPYASRVLGPEGLGTVNYTFSIIETFLFLSTIGIPIYGIREISKNRDNKFQRVKISKELIFIHLISSTLFSLILILFTLNNDKLFDLKNIIFIQSLMIIINVFSIDWYFQGLERYSYLLIVNSISKTLSVIYLFSFVKDENDLLFYSFFQIIVTVFNSIINYIVYKKEKINFTVNVELSNHIPSLVRIFLINVSASLYTQIDKIMIGTLVNTEAVGLYVVGNKVIRLILVGMTSITSVFIPRISYYIKTKLDKEISTLVSNYIFVLLLVSPIIAIQLIVLSDDIINVISGSGYSRSIDVLNILVFLIIVIPFTNLFSNHILFNYGYENTLSIISIISMIINILLNLLLIKTFELKGAAYASVLSEFLSLLIQYSIIKHYRIIEININWKNYFIIMIYVLVIISLFTYIDRLIVDRNVIKVISLVLFTNIAIFLAIYRFESVREIIKGR